MSAILARPGVASAAQDPIERAMTAIGGREVVERVRSIRWSGTAKVLAGAKTLDLGVETFIEPFVRARSDSWPLNGGRSAMRTLMIEGDRGFKVVDGRQSALSPAATINERQQFGAYGYLLMTGARWTTGTGNALHGTRPGYPPIDIRCGKDGRMASADYVVASADEPDASGMAGKLIRERFVFAGTVIDKGLRWPARIAILQNDRPFFNLSIDQFFVDLR